jgi:hypothetical protein
MPRVSVCIPCYNYAEYFPDALSSVFRQSFTDWEAIITDDASTDSSWEVIQSFSDPRIIRIRHTQNLGNIATYNEAIRRSSGDFVALLSADDRYHPAFLERTVEILERHPAAAMVYTGCEIMDAQGNLVRRVTNPVHKTDGVYDELPSLLFGCHIPHSSVLIRRSILLNLGGYDPALSKSADWDLWLKAASRYPVAFLKEPLYQYRRHGKNMSVSLETLIRTEQEMDLIFGRALELLEHRPELRPLTGQIRARHSWSDARLRFMRADWSGGARALGDALRKDIRLLASPRRVAGMILAAAHGFTGRVVFGI